MLGTVETAAQKLAAHHGALLRGSATGATTQRLSEITTCLIAHREPKLDIRTDGMGVAQLKQMSSLDVRVVSTAADCKSLDMLGKTLEALALPRECVDDLPAALAATAPATADSSLDSSTGYYIPPKEAKSEEALQNHLIGLIQHLQRSGHRVLVTVDDKDSAVAIRDHGFPLKRTKPLA